RLDPRMARRGPSTPSTGVGRPRRRRASRARLVRGPATGPPRPLRAARARGDGRLEVRRTGLSAVGVTFPATHRGAAHRTAHGVGAEAFSGLFGRRVPGAARCGRSPVMTTTDAYISLFADLAEEHQALDDVVAPLSEAEWSMPTPAEGWSIRD